MCFFEFTQPLAYTIDVNCVLLVSSTGALDDGSATMPDMFVSKYNKFVDSIFERINTILKKSYDPVNVQLNMEGVETKSTTGHKKSNKK